MHDRFQANLSAAEFVSGRILCSKAFDEPRDEVFLAARQMADLVLAALSEASRSTDRPAGAVRRVPSTQRRMSRDKVCPWLMEMGARGGTARPLRQPAICYDLSERYG